MKIKFEKGIDVERLAASDQKDWVALSCPTTGLRIDRRMLELMDTDRDGRIRAPEVLGAIAFLKSRGVDLDSLFAADASDAAALDDVLRRQAALGETTPTEEERKAMSEWKTQAASAQVAELGDKTPAANAAFAEVEKLIGEYFAPGDETALVLAEGKADLPLDGRLNLKYFDAMSAFTEKCVKPIFGAGKSALSFADFKSLSAKFAPYRAHLAAKPVFQTPQKDALDDEERAIRYKMHLVEFLENFVTMRRLYERDVGAIFQTGTLRIDGRDLKLCFHVDDEAAHSALAAKSKCCLLYVKLSRPADKAVRSVCAVVTAGSVATLYVGRNGVFYDRDGRDWEAVVTKVVEAQVSLREAFWSPWRKIGEGVADTLKKFLGDRQAAATASVTQKLAKPTAAAEGGGGAAMASSVAAIGIGVGMVGAACASLMAALSHMTALQIAVSVAVIILAVSLPNVILTYFKLRKRDLGAILNASGWAVNRPMRLSMRLARSFTASAK